MQSFTTSRKTKVVQLYSDQGRDMNSKATDWEFSNIVCDEDGVFSNSVCAGDGVLSNAVCTGECVFSNAVCTGECVFSNAVCAGEGVLRNQWGGLECVFTNTGRA